MEFKNGADMGQQILALLIIVEAKMAALLEIMKMYERKTNADSFPGCCTGN